MGRQTLPVAGLLLAAALAAGCAPPEAGSPTSASDPSGAPTVPGGTTARAEVDLASIDPCTMLTEAQAQQVGVPSPGVRDDIAGLLSCDWQLSIRDDPEFNTGMLVTVSLDPDGGVDELNLPETAVVTPTTVGDHEGQVVAKGGFGGEGECQVDLILGPNSKAQVFVIAAADTERACDVATRAAVLVEPKLP